MSPDYQIGMLWISGRLSYLEQLCVKSFVDAGHHVKLYTYEPVEGIPEGVETADASERSSRSKGFLRMSVQAARRFIPISFDMKCSRRMTG